MIRDELDIQEHLHQIIFHTYNHEDINENSEENPGFISYNKERNRFDEDSDNDKNSLWMLKQYNMLKEFLINNSIPLEAYHNHENSRIFEEQSNNSSAQNHNIKY